MNELQRMQYLDAMGIDSFVPRVVLPNAKAPVVCVLPDQASGSTSTQVPDAAVHALANTPAESASPGRVAEPSAMGLNSEGGVAAVSPEPSPVVSAQVANEGGAGLSSAVGSDSSLVPANDTSGTGDSARRLEASVNEVLDGKALDGTALNTTVEGSGNRPAQSAAEKVELASFSLCLWRVSESVQVIDSRRPGAALPTHALLANILTQLKIMDRPLPAAEILDWPLVDNSSYDQSWHAATDMVNAFLEGKLLAKPVSTILLMGDDAVNAVLGKSSDHEALHFQWRDIDTFACRGLILPSLADILYSPTLKKPVWRALLDIQ